jgi:hypothetical protein
MTGPRDELHDALLELESSAPFGSPPPFRDRPTRRLLWVAVGTVAVGAVLAGVVIGNAVMSRPDVGQGTPIPSAATPSATPTDVPEPVPTLSATADPTSAPTLTPGPTRFGMSWEQVEWPGDERARWVTYDAVLELWFADGGRSIWISTDRVTWEPATVESAGCDDEEADCNWSINGVVRLGDRLVGAGLIRSLVSDASWLASWVSLDGQTWSLTATNLPGGGQTPSVAESNGAVLLLAADRTAPESGTVHQVSSDGVTWEAVSGAEGIKLFDVYGDEDGFLAVGEEITWDGEAYQTRPIVRASSDGRSWTTVTVGEPDAGILTAVTRMRSGAYVVAGRDEEGRLFTWRSGGSDEPWTVARPGQNALPSNFERGVGAPLTTVEPGVVLGGVEEARTSVDGMSWDVAEAPGGVLFVTMATGQDRIVAFARPTTTSDAWSLWVGEVVPTN